MTREELEEVFHIEKEIKNLNKRIQNYEDNPKMVKSVGKCSNKEFPYNEQHYGVECAVRNPKQKVLQRKLDQFKAKLEIKKQEIEDYIETIPFSEIRQIFRYRYLDNKNWVQIAHEMNKLYQAKEYSEGSVRLKHDRYLEKKLKKFSKRRFCRF